MVLKNAFEAIATEQTLDEAESHLRRIYNALNLAKDTADRLIVNVATGTLSGLAQINWGNANTYPVWYSTGSPNSMDAREQQRMLARANFMAARHHRWTFS